MLKYKQENPSKKDGSLDLDLAQYLTYYSSQEMSSGEVSVTD